MILVTGAAGKTGRAVIAALKACEQPVRALVHKAPQATEMTAIGAEEALAAELLDEKALAAAFRGVRAVYHICPNMHPGELEIGQIALKCARKAGVHQFVLHSVLRPQIQEMPHHWNKLLVEELLINSGLSFTILQPASYMQNILREWQRIRSTGRYQVPYSLKAAFSPVDLQDVAEVAAIVLTSASHIGAVYELAGPEIHTPESIARCMEETLGKPVRPLEMDSREWGKQVDLDPGRKEMLLRMFEYYAEHGLWGNSRVLASLLERTPTTLREFLSRHLGDAESR